LRLEDNFLGGVNLVFDPQDEFIDTPGQAFVYRWQVVNNRSQQKTDRDRNRDDERFLAHRGIIILSE